MRFTVVYLGLAILAMAQPAMSFDFFGLETASTEGNHLRRLDEEPTVVQLSQQEQAKLRAEREELVGKRDELKILCGRAGNEVGDKRKRFKEKAEEHKEKQRECKAMDAGAEEKTCIVERKKSLQARNDLKRKWKDARKAARPEQKELKAVIRELRQVRRKLKRGRKAIKSLKKARKRQRSQNRRKRRNSVDVRRELVDGHCVADHKCAAIRGDPHFQTFDGERYDCQGEGEFVVAKVINSESTFEIQARFENIGASEGRDRRVSITKAVSITTGVEGEPDLDVFTGPDEDGDDCSLFYFVDGNATTFETAVPGISYEAGDAEKGTSDYVFFTGSGLMYSVFAKSGKFGCVLNSKICLPPSMVEEEDIVGLLGSPDGDKSNDWTSPGGSPLDMSDIGKAAGYAYCTQNWCVRNAADSIFAYLEGTDHSTFFNCDAEYDNSADIYLMDPPAECVDCCKTVDDEKLNTECIEECSMADQTERTEQCLNDIDDAELLQDVESKCANPKIPGDCNSMMLNKNCNWRDGGAHRLFVDEDTTLAGCQAMCAGTDGCTFYAFGHEGSDKENWCTGCATEEAGLLNDDDYDAYPAECKPEETEPKKAPPLEGQCSDMILNTKCPHKKGNSNHPDRLYRKEHQTLASCQALCQADEDCGYYSFGTAGVENAQHEDVCMGCSSSSAKETHIGFNFYSQHCLGEKAEDPKENLKRCEHMHLDKKCKNNDNRLFRTPAGEKWTIDQCHETCETTEGCNFFSFDEDGRWAGVCIGCQSVDDAESHAPFVFYPVDCEPTEPTPEKVTADHGECPDMYLNTKCAHKLDDVNHPDRLFRSESETLESCQQLCKADQSCGFYSFGSQDAGGFAGVCMGCSGSESMETHTGFNFYSIDCVGDQEDPPDNEEVCARMLVDTKCGDENGNRLFMDNDDIDLEACQKKCEDTDGCNFFSFMDEESDESFGGTCMGCKSLADAVVHPRFTFYNKACKPIDATGGPKKAPPVVGQCPDMYVNTKCPYQHGDRLFREEGIESVEACQTQCEEDDSCLYYSFGTEAVTDEDHVGVCMGCTAESAKEYHTGFNFYSVGCVGEEVVDTRMAVCPMQTKTCPDGTVLSMILPDCEFKDCPTPDDESDDVDDKAGTKGDPHFKTFGGEFYDFHGECDLALLKNPLFKDGLGMEIHIRTKITDWWSSVQAAAIKIGDDVLEIQGGNLDKWLWINGVENEDMEEGKWYHSSIAGFLVRYKKQGVGMEALIYLQGAKEFLVLKTFKDFVRVDINWKESDNYHGATGLLGSYELKGDRVGRDGATHIANHNAFGQEWQVGAEEPKLFHSYEGAVASPNKCILPSDAELAEKTQRRLAESNLTMEAIENACGHLHKEAERKGCEYDVISTQDISMSSSVW